MKMETVQFPGSACSGQRRALPWASWLSPAGWNADKEAGVRVAILLGTAKQQDKRRLCVSHGGRVGTAFYT